MEKETSLYICPYLYLYIFHVKDHHLFGNVENRIETSFFFRVEIVGNKKTLYQQIYQFMIIKLHFFFFT